MAHSVKQADQTSIPGTQVTSRAWWHAPVIPMLKKVREGTPSGNTGQTPYLKQGPRSQGETTWRLMAPEECPPRLTSDLYMHLHVC